MFCRHFDWHISRTSVCIIEAICYIRNCRVIRQKTASPPHVDGIPYTLQWAAPAPQDCHSPWGNLDLHLMHRSLGPSESTTRGHLDRFGHFCRADSCDNSQTDHATQSVTVGGIYVCCSLIITLSVFFGVVVMSTAIVRMHLVHLMIGHPVPSC